MFVFSHPSTFTPPNEQFDITFTSINGALFSDLCSAEDVEFVTIGITDLAVAEEIDIDCVGKYDYISFSLTQLLGLTFKQLDIAVSESYFSSKTFRYVYRSNLFDIKSRNYLKLSITTNEAI